MIRVLLADDHAIVRDGLKLIMADTDDLVVCGEVCNGTELMRMIVTQKFDLLVLDISMPGRNGLELIKLVRKERRHLPILILSMHKEEQYALRALHAGASGYVTKESHGEVLVAAMRKVAGGGVFASDRVVELLARQKIPHADTLPHTQLSNRELAVFEELVAGRRLIDIAKDLNLSTKTVSSHKARILQKMRMSSDAELAQYALLHDLRIAPR